jgi:glycosyltransferase involved in cell wall biosynthesis
MGFANRYIDKNKGIYFFEAPKEIEPTPIWVIIPCYNEPDLEQTIQSVFNCRQPKSPIGILVVVNDSDLETDEIYLQNEKTFAELSLLAKESPYWISLHSIYASKLPSKNAGVGWARKIGMDWAITHFNSTGLNDGILVSLDADSLVSSNYFCIIEAYYHEHTNTIAATHYFEHVISEDVDSMAIVWYELYVRFYKNMLDSIGFPHSIYTVGSCFSVKAKAYVAQGGMNRKKAGEDFYFLHKLMPLGLVGNINNLTVYPSSRISDRVPFGTGPALQKHILGQTDLTACYPISSFEIIKDFIRNNNGTW